MIYVLYLKSHSALKLENKCKKCVVFATSSEKFFHNAVCLFGAAPIRMKINKCWIFPFRQTMQLQQIALFKDFIAHCGTQGHYECCLNLLDFGLHMVRRILHLRFDLEFEV